MRGKPALILGGRGKGLSYAPLAAVLPQKSCGAVLFGENAREIAEALGKDFPFRIAQTMDEAVEAAWEICGGREDILLSPASTSFDRYKNFAERGKDFARAAAALARKVENDATTPSNKNE